MADLDAKYANNPFVLKYDDFVKAVSPHMNTTSVADASNGYTAGHWEFRGGDEHGSDFWVGPSGLGNAWASPEGQNGSVSLTLADGRTWTPSGASSGITYHPVGEPIYEDRIVGYDGSRQETEKVQVGKNDKEYWEVSGDMSALMGKDGSNVHQNIRYERQGDYLVPVNQRNWEYGGGGFLGGLADGIEGFLESPIAPVMLAMVGAGVAGWSSAAAEGAAAGAAADTAAMAGVVGGTAASGAAPLASGVAGMIGMEAGVGATALNAGVMNAGINLAAGGDLESALTAGVKAAALSPVGGWASDAAKDLLPTDWSSSVKNAIGTVAGGAAKGGTAAALAGDSVGDGIINGAKSGLINASGHYVGDLVTDATGSTTLGGAASGGTSALLSGRDVVTGLIGGAIDGYTEVPGVGSLVTTIIDPSSLQPSLTPADHTTTGSGSGTTGGGSGTPASTKRSLSVNGSLFSGFDINGWSAAIRK